MRVLLFSVLTCLAAAAQPQQIQVGVEIQPEAQYVVLVFQRYLPQPDGLPIVKVRLGKVQMHQGAFAREVPLSIQDREELGNLLRQQFRLYRGPSQLGIFKYQEVPNERRPTKSGLYIEALPIDKDATVQALREETREKADLLNLLNMSTEDALKVTEDESKFTTALKAARDGEIAILKQGRLDHGRLFFMPVRVKR